MLLRLAGAHTAPGNACSRGRSPYGSHRLRGQLLHDIICILLALGDTRADSRRQRSPEWSRRIGCFRRSRQQILARTTDIFVISDTGAPKFAESLKIP